MTDTVVIEEQAFIHKWVVWIVGLVLVLVVAVYTMKFNGALSDNQEKWGQFGDFVGGVVNPIVGFVTILLLAVSLRQNNIALSHARKELELTRQAVVDAKQMQETTERALVAQTEITAHARDMNNAMALWANLVGTLDKINIDLAHPHLSLDARLEKESRLRETAFSISKLGNILILEEERLLNKYLGGMVDGASSEK